MRRVWVVYRKELVESLRDRRTLIGMLLVPLLLYPVLMVVVLQALQIEKVRRERDTYRLVVPDQRHERWLRRLFEADRAALAGDVEASTSRPGDPLRVVINPAQFEVLVRGGPLDEVVQRGEAEVAMSVVPAAPEAGLGDGINREVRIDYDPAEHRSDVAYKALMRVLGRYSERTVVARLEGAGLSDAVLQPLRIRERSVATPQKLGGSLLGQILPFLLVTMTITGAIYPAIDLTAGERERGTLETLMVAPVPTSQIVAGKFLVVVTIAMLASLLNLGSMGATVRFGGLGEAFAQAAPGGETIGIPLRTFPIVIAAMIPFAVLFSAVMMAVCSFARTFKEAQNYMTPVMIAALLPAMITSYIPSVKLTGVMPVVPVANVVVLLRELFLGHFDAAGIVLAVGSTCFYAATAVVVATRLYGQEAVLFSDVGSYRTLLRRRFMRPQPAPSLTAALLLVAVVFPLSFYFQTWTAAPSMTPARVAATTAALMLGCFLAPPVVAALYFKFDMSRTFKLGTPATSVTAGAILLAAAAPMLTMAYAEWQRGWMPMPEDVARAYLETQERILALPTAVLLIVFAVLPGLCEEAFFRGFVLSGLARHARPGTAVLASGVLFGLFHVDAARLPVTIMMGVLLGAVCWWGGSIWPAVLIHVVNNGAALMAGKHESVAYWYGAAEGSPGWLRPGAIGLLVAGLVLILAGRRGRSADVDPVGVNV